MIDEYIDDIQRIKDDGAVVVIKWDGAREALRQTVVITRQETAYVWHRDCDDIALTLQEAISAYKRAHP